MKSRLTANAAEAREIAGLAAKSDRVVMEAIHYRYHPLALRVEQIVASGDLGKLDRVEAACCWRHPSCDLPATAHAKRLAYTVGRLETHLI
ncbi:hypothetical protein MFM001_46640 [Mycobacterium sp. MFM001]|nr:hypothetical protein MFM001_46640 [Mycobacterium sp. MFM001]